MLEGQRVVRRVEGPHVPLVDEHARQVEPRLCGEGIAWVGVTLFHRVPVASREGAVMSHDGNHLGTDMGLEHRSRDLGVARVAERLADVVEERSQHHLVVGARAHGAAGHLQRMRQLADVPSVADIVERPEVIQDSRRPPTLPTQPIHGLHGRRCAHAGRPGGRPTGVC